MPGKVSVLNQSTLRGVRSVIKSPDGVMLSCCLSEPNKIPTACGTLVPRWGPEDERSRPRPALSFYPDGSLRSIYLQQMTTVTTPIGPYPAELLIFYPEGTLQRLFPLNGQLSGFWELKDEQRLCPQLSFHLFCGSFKGKMIGLHFFASGALRSLTLWPGETIVLRTNVGLLPVRHGAAFYEDGRLESLEPAEPLLVATPLGNMTAYDSSAAGLQGDRNSLAFNSDGSMRSIVSSTDQVQVIKAGRELVTFAPLLKPDPLQASRQTIAPLRVEFHQTQVSLSNGEQQGSFDFADCCFRTSAGSAAFRQILQQPPLSCGDCGSCHLCG
ncbi:MAG: hypothetical protein PHR21_05740 [Oscillospiraceae bacterium]|nr:hypothetical protein [Oscillospiraceae bacterium]MDD4367821.1 hypothetical protein [Oscillospiraceae bacterium]